MADTENRQLYDTKVIAQLFNVTVRRIQQLTQDGVLKQYTSLASETNTT